MSVVPKVVKENKGKSFLAVVGVVVAGVLVFLFGPVGD